jgi:hypothetical protein
MNKQSVIIAIALLLGWGLGAARGDTGAPTAYQQSITRADLFEAAALCGMLSNQHFDPSGWNGWGIGKFQGPDSIMADAKEYRKLGEK